VNLSLLAARRPVNNTKFRAALDRVAQYRKLTLVPLVSVLVGYSEIAQTRWAAWLRKQRPEASIPIEFSAVLDYIVSFADPIISSHVSGLETWGPAQRQ
jgi:hypothetical protein